MRVGTNVRVKRSVLKQTAATANRRAAAVVAKTARDCEAAAKDRCPVDTGNLKNSIQARQLGVALWEVRVGADYGIYVHDGTRFMPPRPFLAQGAAAVTPAFKAAIAQIVKF